MQGIPPVAEPVYFAVVSWQGREQARLFHDQPPRKSPNLIYCTRMPERMAAAPLAEMMLIYRALRKAGKLPPEDRGPRPPPATRETTISREYWKPPPVTWDRDAPAYPPLGNPPEPASPERGRAGESHAGEGRA
jgi:hypothetical protein